MHGATCMMYRGHHVYMFVVLTSHQTQTGRYFKGTVNQSVTGEMFVTQHGDLRILHFL